MVGSSWQVNIGPLRGPRRRRMVQPPVSPVASDIEALQASIKRELVGRLV